MRLTRIDNVDLNLFDFDYDLTFMVFFLDAQEKVYARYGGRDADSADNRQSLEGLRYTMQSVLKMHAQEEKAFAAKAQESPKFIRDISKGKGGGCMHCHQVRERLNANLRKSGNSSRDLAWRYPLPENLGFVLEVERGNVVKSVTAKSAASTVGVKAGDVVHRLNGTPVHSFADAQHALDRAPKQGSIEIAWQRDGQALKGSIALVEGWRRTDITWRHSVRRLVPTVRLAGIDLTSDEKQTLGLSAKQLAFRPKFPMSAPAQAIGLRAGDVILGLDGLQLEMVASDFWDHVHRNYLVGDRVALNVLRDGKRLNLPMTLQR